MCERIQGPVYRLAFRMLGHPADAEDATQEIVIQVVTGVLVYEVARRGVIAEGERQLTAVGLGQSTAIGIGGVWPSGAGGGSCAESTMAAQRVSRTA